MLSLQLIAQADPHGTEWAALAAYSETLFVYYANQVPVIFAFKRADNEENRARGIVGQNSGYRQGVRNLNYVPASLHPASPSAQPVGSTITYYDLGRQEWRSYRRGNLIAISAFWSEELGVFVDTPEQAGLVGGVPFEASPRNGEAQINEARKQRSDARQARRRAHDTARKQLGGDSYQQLQAIRRQNLVTRTSR